NYASRRLNDSTPSPLPRLLVRATDEVINLVRSKTPSLREQCAKPVWRDRHLIPPRAGQLLRPVPGDRRPDLDSSRDRLGVHRVEELGIVLRFLELVDQ